MNYLEPLLESFIKVLKINLNDGSYETIINKVDGPISNRSKENIIAWVEEG